MAYSPNSTNLPRRRALVSFIWGIAAASTIVGRTAGAALPLTTRYAEADAQLFACWREYLKMEIELNAAQDARDLVSWNARQAYPPKPDCVASGRVKVITSEIDANVQIWAATSDMKTGRRPAAEHMAEVEAWERKCQEINMRFGLRELESAFKAAWDRQWAAFDRFIAMPATTVAGLAIKTSAIFYFEDRTCRAWRGIATDPKQLEPEQQILLTMRRDLLRMAGLPDDFAMAYCETDEQYFATSEWLEP